jgi:PAS domain S-box-containing protein
MPEASIRKTERDNKIFFEKTVPDQNENYLAVPKDAPIAIYEIDFSTFKFKQVNQLVSRLLGYTEQELLTLKVSDLLADSSKSVFRQNIAKALKGKQFFFKSEVQVKTKNGSSLWGSFNSKVIFSDEKPTSIIVFAQDITEQKEMQAKLQEYANNLEKLVEERTKQLQGKERMAAIGETARMIGHDIRNPLQAIAGDLFLIDNDVASLNESEVKASLQESVKCIQDNLQYIAKIVEDLQDYARPLKPNKEIIIINKVIEDVMLIVPVTSNHQVIFNVEKGLPEFTSDSLILKRIITNLVQNAIQAMPDGGRLTIQAYHRDTHIFITVEDTGVGIPEEFKPKIFMPMMTTKAKGQGLGLAVVKRLVEILNGTISFESQEGKGTTFTIGFPIN